MCLIVCGLTCFSRMDSFISEALPAYLDINSYIPKRVIAFPYLLRKTGAHDSLFSNGDMVLTVLSHKGQERVLLPFPCMITYGELMPFPILRSSIIILAASIKKNFDLVHSVKGIGLINAINTIVYTNNFKSFESPRKYACYIGVAPFDHTSGTSVKGKTQVSKICRTQQKSELSMAARSAIIHDPGLKRYYQRKIKEKGGGKSAHGIVLNAIKFKLILRMFAVVRSGEPYKVLNY